MTAHVHAEVIKALADDNTLPVETESDNGVGVWGLLAIDRACIIGWVEANPNRAVRIKPQPKAICWMNVYRDGDVGRRCSEKAGAMESKLGDAIAMLEVRDDGTAHLHKVEA